MPTQDLVDRHSASYPKALGIAWNSDNDTIATHVQLPSSFVPTKRGLISDIARTFDVLGWISPVILQTKLLMQQLWVLKLGWDEEVPDHVKLKYERWREELPLLQTIQLPRCYQSEAKAVTVQLHGFCDASEAPFSAVVYIRATYASSLTTCRLVMSKTRVASLKTQSIPRLELCGALLLAEILDTTRETLGIPKEDVSAWCDSTIVLAWLKRCLRDYQTVVANRISKVTSLLPPSAWRHVPTLENTADCASRGLTARELKEHELWWNGPPWLSHNPITVPRQLQAAELATVQSEEAKPSVCQVTRTTPAEWFEHKYSSHRTLLHVTAWVQATIRS